MLKSSYYEKMSLKTLFLTLLGLAVTVQSLPGAGPADKRALNAAAERGGFKRFTWVTDRLRDGDRLARASAPYYNDNDADHKLTEESIKFLQEQKITHVISLNHKAHTPEISNALRWAGIAYTPLPVEDYGNPTSKDFRKAYKAFDRHRTGTLVWCGYGHGRTGTMISALQAYTEAEKTLPQPLTRADYDANHVEKPGQRNTLNQLQWDLGILSELPPLEAFGEDGEPPAKKPRLASAADAIFGLTPWQTFDSLLETEGPAPEDLISDADLRSFFDQMLTEYPPIPSPPQTDVCVASLSADEQAIWESLEAYGPVGSMSEAQVQQVLNEIMVEYPAAEASVTGGSCANGAGAFGDADLMALLDTLPVVAETELLAADAGTTAGVEAGVEALGDEDILAMLEAAPAAVEEPLLLEALAEEAVGSSLLESLVKAALELHFVPRALGSL
ncbi:protein-tyrosine phosphatase [Metarhizium album ARSEF 1941]|uniref:Protein-tyrosine phosphatase n=1 Tax=Metarhizium album (strain ARSEF 1941) TaxID=1081103 RepID=A0A0B2X3R8_METAS|nr:protein-tyrosine phosphatase [Metarhizium album ARSEF 1941]KHO00994.1 protein-tyrosine phosphatase [Metarhizium album ARSEF 1941]